MAAAYRQVVEERGRALSDAREVAESLDAISAELSGERPTQGLLLMGNVGSGKTTAMWALRRVVNYLARRGFFSFMPRGWKADFPFVMAAYLADIARDPKKFDTLRRAPLLGIDDLGTDPVEVQDYGNILYPMTRLLEHRYQEQLFTVITTNLNRDDIASVYDERIADRLNEMAVDITFYGESFR